jgi:hypothetical protein
MRRFLRSDDGDSKKECCCMTPDEKYEVEVLVVGVILFAVFMMMR